MLAQIFENRCYCDIIGDLSPPGLPLRSNVHFRLTITPFT